VELVADDLIALQRATHALVQALDSELSDLGLSASETNLLACLAPDGPRRVRELIADTGQRPSTVTGILDRLEQRGLVDRQLDPDDRRSFRVALTTDGASMHGWVLEGFERVAGRARQSLSGRGPAEFRAALRAIESAR
jgi:DNA-binding MarR family transcriptional regulator